MSSNDFDTIIIGSGIGGLVCASILAQQRRQRVLVLERHFKAGGYTHTFSRKGKYEWDVGVHYVGEMQRGMKPRALLDYATQGNVDWVQLPDDYERLVFPGLTFRFASDETKLVQDLVASFPQERAAIQQYFQDIRRAQNWYRKYLFATLDARSTLAADRTLSEPDAALVLTHTGRYLETRFRDPRLRAIAAGQWGDYGVPPAQSAFLAHANVVSHYRFGGYYPLGGSGHLEAAIRPIIEAHGGRVLVNHEVEEILVKDGRARGVRVRGSSREFRGVRELSAEAVISNAGAVTTYTKLFPASVPNPYRELLQDFPQSMGVATAYLGLRESPRALGFEGENNWLFSSFDHDAVYARRHELLEGRANFCYLSFPSLKNPHAEGHTAELTAPIDIAQLQAWAGQPWKRRGEDYERLKQRIAQGLTDAVEAAFPGFRSLVDYIEVATPLTAQHFTGHAGGAIYGVAAIPERYRSACFRVHTPIENLFLTGSDVGTHGVVGAAVGGLMTASALLGPQGNFLKLLAEMEQYSASLKLAS
jgi:all-trans-retinol 13,14-reductase